MSTVREKMGELVEEKEQEGILDAKFHIICFALVLPEIVLKQKMRV